MEAGLIFHFARRTDDCGEAIKHTADCFGINIPVVKPCTNDGYLNSRIANMLKKVPILFLVGRAEEKRPDCAGQIFKTLRVPLDGKGEPKGVMSVCGKEKTGYIIESIKQAIVLLPDLPEEIDVMLPEVFERLKDKFELTGEMPSPVEIDYEKLAQDCIEHSSGYGKI